MEGLVSTIIPVFNRPALLREAVQSVLDQTYRPIEIIIVDDGSTDSTPQVIRELKQSSPEVIRSIRQDNAGPGVARESGRLAAQGEFIQYLDSDDLLLPRKFEVQVEAFCAHPGFDIAYGKTLCAFVGQPPTPEAQRRTGEKITSLFPALLLSRWWFTNTPLYRRSLTDRLGPWLPLWNEEDWEYDARAAVLGVGLCCCDEVVSVQRSHKPEQHLCYQGTTDPRKLRDRSIAHGEIFRHARDAGIGPDVSEMQYFARELFLLSRQCGAAGLANESERLFALAREASGSTRGKGTDFLAYRMLAGIFGWVAMGKVACWADRYREK